MDRGTFHRQCKKHLGNDPKKDSKIILLKNFLRNKTVIPRTYMGSPGKHSCNLVSLICLSRNEEIAVKINRYFFLYCLIFNNKWMIEESVFTFEGLNLKYGTFGILIEDLRQ